MGTSGTDQEEFCLRWNDFESSISSAFRNLRNDPDFCDVRLAVKDRSRPLKAHKVVLSSCSPYFSSLLREMNAEQQNSLSPFYIMMRGVTHSQLSGILDFMYYGEANVAQEDLDQFLALAEELQVKGLTSKNGSGGGDKPTSYTPSTPAAKKRHTPAAPEAATPSAAAATPSKRARQSSPAPKASIKTEEVIEDAFDDDNFDDAEADDAYGGGEEEAFDDEQEDPGEGTSASGGAGGSGAGYNDDDKDDSQSGLLTLEVKLEAVDLVVPTEDVVVPPENGTETEQEQVVTSATATDNHQIITEHLTELVDDKNPSKPVGYECNFCQTVFEKGPHPSIWRSRAVRHVKNKHLEANIEYACPNCHSAYTTVDRLQRHMLEKHDVKSTKDFEKFAREKQPKLPKAKRLVAKK